MTCLVAHDGPAGGAIRLVNNGAATNHIQWLLRVRYDEAQTPPK